MNEDTFLYTIPQWFVFAGIIASVYGWVEHKKVFRMIGPAIFILLGLFAVYTLLSGYFSAWEFLTPEEIVNEEMEEEIMEEIPIQVRLMPAYLGFMLSGLLAIPAIILEWKNRKGKSLFMILTGLTSLFGFFIITGALRNL